MSERILCILPTNGHGGCEYNALTALKYFKNKYSMEVIVAFAETSETEFIKELCNKNELSYVLFSETFVRNDTAELAGRQRSATRELIKEIHPDVAFIPLPWPKRGQGVIVGCADCACPAIVKFALVPVEYSNDDYIMPEVARAQKTRQVWYANSRFSAELIEKHWNLKSFSVDSFEVGPIGLSGLVPDVSPAIGTDCKVSVHDELNIPYEDKIAITVARLVNQKGYDTYMAAAPEILQKCPDLHLLWVGHGDMYDDILAWLTDTDLGDRIHLLGFRNDIRRLLKASDFFVFPTRYEGGCSQALLEAMEEALPVVTTDTSGIPLVAHHNKNALLTSVDDPQCLAENVIKLANDEDFASQLGLAAQQDVKKYSAIQSFENTLLLMRRALVSGGGLAPKSKDFYGKLYALSSSKIDRYYSTDKAFGSGWHQLERTPSGERFRWMGKKGFLWTSLFFDKPAVIHLYCYMVLNTNIAKKIQLFVDGIPATPIEEKITSQSFFKLSWSIKQPLLTQYGGSVLTIISPQTVRPMDIYPSSTDQRDLSIAILYVEIQEE